MKEKNIENAKEIFLNHGCSHFFMSRDDTYGEYEKYKISKKQELEWLTEYLSLVATTIHAEKSVRKTTLQLIKLSTAIGSLQNYAVPEQSMRDVVNLVYEVVDILTVKFNFSNLDTFSFIRLAESVLNLYDKIDKMVTLKKKINVELSKNANMFLRKNKTVSDEFRVALQPVDFLDDILDKRLNSIISRCKLDI